MRVDGKSVVIGLVIGVVIGLFVPFNLFNLLSKSNYVKVTVVEGQPEVVKIEGKEYTFGFLTSNATSLVDKPTLVVMTESILSKTFDAIEGITYKAYGIEIVVSEVHSDYVVLLVKSTVIS